LLPANASLINFARGPIVEDASLKAALDRAALDHAVLDVFATEPLPADSWHWDHPRVTVLPHISAPTDRETASGIVADNIRQFRESGSIPACVDRGRGY
jgi:glyoxylate/hydroxypyruvate reductase